MKMEFRAKMAKQGNMRIIIVPKEYLWDAEGFLDKLLHVVVTTIEKEEPKID